MRDANGTVMKGQEATVHDWVAYRAGVAPAHPALVANGQSWTFAALDAGATRLARQLATLGVGEGGRVAALLPNVPELVILVHAVLRAGATLVPLNIRASAQELAWLLADAAPQVVLIESRTAALFAEASVRSDVPLSSVAVHLGKRASAESAAVSLDSVAESPLQPRLVHRSDHVAAILYTSGTTGQPKGAMLTVGNFWWNAIGSALNLGTHVSDRWLACLPLYHVGGLAIVTRAAVCGVTIVLHDGFDAARANRSIEEDAITIVSVVGTMLHRMLDARADRPYPSSLRCVLLGGGPAPPSLLERCARAAVPVALTYGLTEATSQVATRAPWSPAGERGSLGRPLYPNAVRIVREDATEAPAGEAGEIVVRGPIVMAGYAGQPEESAHVLRGGWLHTGDVGCIDAAGELHVLDRRDDLIVTGGENVYPAEVEAVLLAHPSVAEAAVFGAPSEAWGARVIAVVRLTADETRPAIEVAAALREHCRAHLAGYKTPDEVRIVSEPLPRTAWGKLRRAELREGMA